MIRCNNCGWYNPDTATHCEMCDEDLSGFPKVDMPDPSQDDEEDVQPVEVPAGHPVEAPVKEEPKAAPEPEVKSEESLQSPKSDPLSATIRFTDSFKSKKESAEKAAEVPGRAFAATVMDASAALKNSTPIECPKCRYPVYGGAETCPNCGATLRNVLQDQRPVSPQPKEMPAPNKSASPSVTVKDPVDEVSSKFKQTVPDFPKSAKETASAVRQVAPRATVRELKATIRELPEELVDKKASASNAPISSYRLIPLGGSDADAIELVPGSIVTIGDVRYRFVKE